jgi:hypothetical protein
MAKKKGKKKAAAAPTSMEFKAPGVTGNDVTANRRYLLITRVRKLENNQVADRDGLIELIEQRNNLHYDEEALRTFERGPGQTASRAYRWKEHQLLRQAYANWEDFLYYQNNVHRWDRMRILDQEDTREEAPIEDPRSQWMFPHKQENPFLQRMLDFYDRHDIGGDDYRAGTRNALGARIERAEGDNPVQVVGHEDLHLWTPTRSAWK